jgi:hypothetical protein
MVEIEQTKTKEEFPTIKIGDKPEEAASKDEKSQVQTQEDIMKAIKDSKVLYLSLSGGWGHTRHWIKQWEKDNSKKIDDDPDWHDSGYICPYCAQNVLEFYVPAPYSTIIYKCSNNHRFSHKIMTAKEKRTLKNEERQDILNEARAARKAEQELVGKKFVENVRYAFRMVRRTPYIDATIIKREYQEHREFYHQKMNSAFKSRTNNISIGAFDSLFSAVDFSDTSTLWERKAGLAKSINDNKIDVMGALIGAMSAYIGSLGVLFPILLLILTDGAAAFGNYLVYGFFAIMFFGFYEGYFNQNRLKRLVKEHKDYTSEFDEITDLIERKKDLRIR